MNNDQGKQSDLIDATDCLEAIGVIKCWKNFLFIIIILCLVLLQSGFWLVNTGYIKTEAKSEAVETIPPAVLIAVEANKPAAIKKETAESVEVAVEINQPNEPAPQKKRLSAVLNIKFKHLSRLVRFLDFVLIPASILYCLTMLFALKISMIGRLGGINHICRAFFLSLVFTVLLLPWQKFFGGVVAGAMFTPAELLSSYSDANAAGVFGTILYYLRFTGYWLLVLLILVFAQLRSVRWARATLRRLEVI